MNKDDILLPSRRVILGGLAGGFALLAAPAVVKAQHLSSNDIWTKHPKGILKKSLTLCMDRSGSMQSDELVIQAEGTAKALNHPNTHYAITNPDSNGCHGIAVSALTFNDSAHGIDADGKYRYLSGKTYSDDHTFWAVLETSDDIAQFSKFIHDKAPVSSTGATHIIAALDATMNLNRHCPHHVLKRVCDVSADGIQSSGFYAHTYAESIKPTLRAEALREKSRELSNNGIAVNGFAMIGGFDGPQTAPMIIDGKEVAMDLTQYFETYLQSPPEIEALDYEGGFTISIVKDGHFRDSYPAGMTRKLMLELA